MTIYISTRADHGSHEILGVFPDSDSAWACVKTNYDEDSNYHYDVEAHEISAEATPYPGLEVGPVYFANISIAHNEMYGGCEHPLWMRHPIQHSVEYPQGSIRVESPISQEHAEGVAQTLRDEWIASHPAEAHEFKLHEVRSFIRFCERDFKDDVVVISKPDDELEGEWFIEIDREDFDRNTGLKLHLLIQVSWFRQKGFYIHEDNGGTTCFDSVSARNSVQNLVKELTGCGI